MFDTKVTGLTDLKAALVGLQAGIDAAAAENVKALTALVLKEAISNFSGTHKKGLPHVPNPQNYPNVVTGTLRRSIQATGVRRDGPGIYGATVGPTAIYGRAIELGRPGHNGAYPYFGPAVKRMRGQAAGIIAANAARYIK